MAFRTSKAADKAQPTTKATTPTQTARPHPAHSILAAQSAVGNQAVVRTLNGDSSNAGQAILHRKCACGGIPGVCGECASCRERRLSNSPSLSQPNHADQETATHQRGVKQHDAPYHVVQRHLSEKKIRLRLTEIETQAAGSNLSQDEVLRLGQERDCLLGELHIATSHPQVAAAPPSQSVQPTLRPISPDANVVQRPPGLSLNQGFQLAQIVDAPSSMIDSVSEGKIVTVLQSQIASAVPSDSAAPELIVAFAEIGGVTGAAVEASLLTAKVAQPGGLLGAYAPFARVPTAAERAMIAAGRAFHYTPVDRLPLIQQPGGVVFLKPSTGRWKNLLTPDFEPSAYAFLGEPNVVQKVGNLAGRGSLAEQGLVIIQGTDLPPGTLFRPMDRTIVMPGGYRGPGVAVPPGGQLPLPLDVPQNVTAKSPTSGGVKAQGMKRIQVLRWGGRLFMVMGIAASGYEIATAPPAKRTRTAIGVTSNFVGGLAGGAAAGLICGPGAPLCSVVLGLTLGLTAGMVSQAAAESIYDTATGP